MPSSGSGNYQLTSASVREDSWQCFTGILRRKEEKREKGRGEGEGEGVIAKQCMNEFRFNVI